MRFIKVFEKFGISSDLEEQVEDIIVMIYEHHLNL